MACHLYGSTQLPEPILINCQMEIWKKFQWNLNQNTFYENAIEIPVCEISAIKFNLLEFTNHLPWYHLAPKEYHRDSLQEVKLLFPVTRPMLKLKFSCRRTANAAVTATARKHNHV